MERFLVQTHAASFRATSWMAIKCGDTIKYGRNRDGVSLRRRAGREAYMPLATARCMKILDHRAQRAGWHPGELQLVGPGDPIS